MNYPYLTITKNLLGIAEALANAGPAYSSSTSVVLMDCENMGKDKLSIGEYTHIKRYCLSLIKYSFDERFLIHGAIEVRGWNGCKIVRNLWTEV